MKKNMAYYDNLEKEALTAVSDLETIVPAKELALFKELMEHNELGIGLEMLLTYIYEYDLEIPKKTYERLIVAGKGFIDDSYFDGIKYKEE